MKPVFPRIPLRRVDLSQESDGLPPSLRDAMESDGGLWRAGDAYTTADEVVEIAKREGVAALRLDFRDLSLLKALPNIRYLHLSSDGRPPLDPITALPKLKALIIETSALRGNLDPAGFPELRWLKIGLGGKGGAAALPAITRGHPRLEWLSISEARSRTAAEICGNYPSLRVLHFGYDDCLRELGGLSETLPCLRKIDLQLT